MYKFFAITLLVAAAAAVPTPDMGLNCVQSNDILSCLAVKASVTIDRAARSTEVQLFDGLTFVRETPVERSGKSLQSSAKQILNELPEDASERAMKLSGMIYDSAANFLKSHSLKVNAEDIIARAISSDVNEGRAKIKKYKPLIYSLLGVKAFALIPLLLGGLGLMVLKALVFSKIAILIAGILGFQKLMGSGSGIPTLFNKSNTASTTWSDPATQSWPAAVNVQNQGYYRRSYEQDAHNLAYSAHVPTTSQQSA